MWQPSCRNVGEEFNSNFGKGLEENKEKKKKKKEEEWWQLICDNGIAEMEGKKKKRIVAMELPKIKGERKYLIGILVCQKKKILWH